jgi:hypothetical protein
MKGGGKLKYTTIGSWETKNSDNDRREKLRMRLMSFSLGGCLGERRCFSVLGFTGCGCRLWEEWERIHSIHDVSVRFWILWVFVMYGLQKRGFSRTFIVHMNFPRKN